MGVSFYYIATRALDLITVILPPALPATLSVGVAAAVDRLKQKRILCVNAAKINVLSKIDRICFDKTGTLTDDGLKIFQVLPIRSGQFSSHMPDIKRFRSSSPHLYRLMTMCHNLKEYDNHLVGDPLEIEMFRFTQNVLPKNSDRGFHFRIGNDERWNILHEFDFSHDLRRMSVLTQESNSSSLVIFTKGSPEAIKCLCLAETGTSNLLIINYEYFLVPDAYDDILETYASDGYRIIACAYRVLDQASSIVDRGRGFFENRMIFLGFVVFENQLKPVTVSVLDEIKRANISTVMVTGDNVFTAISVARACRIVGVHEDVFLPNSFGLNRMDLVIKSRKCRSSPQISLESISEADIAIACSGDNFDCILSTLESSLMGKFLRHCRIYFRMSPMQKKRLVEAYQTIGECVCFCGDGANDCAALTAADVGVSLSKAETSVAAPFTSNVCDISCIPILLRNGRSSIITSIASFKFMSLYSIIQFTTLSFLYTFGSTLSDWQFIYMDLVLIIPLGILINKYAPAENLSLKRPGIKLISLSVLGPVFIQMFLQAIFQAGVFYYTRTFISQTEFADGPNVENAEATCLAQFSNFVYIAQALIFSEGYPHRQSHYCKPLYHTKIYL